MEKQQTFKARVKSMDEIRKTLDRNGICEGVYMAPQMESLCGRVIAVRDGSKGRYQCKDWEWAPEWVDVIDVEAMVADEETNPKKLMADRSSKPQLQLVPTVALEILASSLDYGANKAPRVDGQTGYGAYNWRDTPIDVQTYVGAIRRHLCKYADGQDMDPDTGGHCHHLGAIMACCAILLDAGRAGTLVDNRHKLPRAKPNKEGAKK